MKIDMFMHSEWFGHEIYVSPNENIYCLYPFDGGLKLLIMDEDINVEKYKAIIDDYEDLEEMTSEVMVYWMYAELELPEIYKTIREIVAEYEENPKEFFKKYNTKGRN